MRVLRWGDGTKWGDINARWGSPSYVLEPGDPGYVDPNPSPPSHPTKKHKKRIMSTNPTPENRPILTGLARAIYAGQLAHGTEVGLKRHLPPETDPAIKKLAGDLSAALGSPERLGSQSRYRMAIDATAKVRRDLNTLSDGAVKEWLTGYRLVMERLHGRKANTGWQAAGFRPGSTRVPGKVEDRLDLISTASAYLSAHSDYEASLPRLDLPPLQITAAASATLAAQFQVARTLLDTHESQEQTRKNERDADLRALYLKISAVINELRDALSDDDPRWELFGLNIPAHPSPPGAATGLTLTAGATGQELAEWAYAVRAEYFRLFLKIHGVDEDFVNIADPKDLEYTLKSLTPGATISVYVVPMNEAGAGPASATVTKVVGE
jgi:hypothetical protein